MLLICPSIAYKYYHSNRESTSRKFSAVSKMVNLVQLVEANFLSMQSYCQWC